MKMLVCIFSFLMVLTAIPLLAQSPAPAASPVQVAAPPIPVVQVQAPAAPPQWAQDIIVSAEKLPVVGPYVAKALVFAGILAALLTALVAFLLTVLSLISGVASFSGLSAFAKQVQDFKDGKIMYWLKYLSMFNAQKKDEPDTLQASVEKAS